jgi:hypothetical protein
MTAMSTLKRSWFGALLVLVPACAHMEKGRGHDSVDELVRARTSLHTGWEHGSPEAKQISDRMQALLQDGLTPEHVSSYADPGWYDAPPGTMALAAASADLTRDGIDVEGPSQAWSDASVRSG